MPRGSERFPRRARLLTSEEFRRVFRTGRRLPAGPLVVIVAENGLDHPRLGLAVSRRHARRATARNRLRRIVRESFRRAQRRLPPVDVVVSARPGAAGAPNRALFAALERCWERLARERARPAGEG